MLRDKQPFLRTNQKSSKAFIIGYTIFLIIIIYITALAISTSIQNIKNEEINQTNLVSSTFIDEPKKSAPDIKYSINSYDETYDTNSLRIINYYDVDGIISAEDTTENYKYRIHFIQIEGLKNKDIQYKINEKLKQKAYTLAFNNNNVHSIVTANFSNILSVLISSDKEVDTLNIDLSSSNEIPINDIFIASTTLNLYLENALYKTLAFGTLIENNYSEGILDMSRVDTSEYEDKFMIFINNYNKSINNLKYTISPNSITFYGLLDKRILNIDNVQNYGVTVDLIDCIKEVAMYKRFTTDRSIFDDDSIGVKNIIVFTDTIIDGNYANKISYGKLQNNIFIEEILFNSNNDEEYQPAKEYVKKLSDNQKANLINQTSNSRGTFFQRAYTIDKNTENNYFIINTTTFQALCSISYFNSTAFLDYIKLQSTPRSDAWIIGFDEYMKDRFSNLEILPVKTESHYIKLTGEFLGNTEEEAIEKLHQEQLEQERIAAEEAAKRAQEEEQKRLQEQQQQQNQQQMQNTVSPNSSIIPNTDNNDSNNTPINNVYVINGNITEFYAQNYIIE